MVDIPGIVWVVSAIVIFLVCYMTFWVLKKAYSKKWEDDEE
ncbi:hypothetical protein [Paenibacillus contaminans]|nr:hypothetical protein [Paenibacillus contaminans]